MKGQISIIGAAIGCMQIASAKITDTSHLWAEPWYDEASRLGVNVKGEVYSNDDDMNRFIKAGSTREGHHLDYEKFSNVQRVMRVFTEEDFEYLFPLRLPLYTYEGFLQAVGKYPAFCGEVGSELPGWSKDEACKRELAVMFAHFNQETGDHNPNREICDENNKCQLLEEWRQALVHITEWKCTEPQPGTGTATCDYKQNFGIAASFPPQPDVQYYGRGPFQLSWNYNYGWFSKIYGESTYDSHMDLLINPDRVHEDSYTVFLAALWFYMTPQAPKMSIHDVASGHFKPTDVDLGNGLVNGFGITTSIINGGLECSKPGQEEDIRSAYRIMTFKNLLNWFGLPAEDESTMECKDLPRLWAWAQEGSYGMVPAYFEKQQWMGRCTLTRYQTPYNAWTQDDYKRCMCEHFGNGAKDCPTVESIPDPEEEEESEDEIPEEEESEQEGDQEEEEGDNTGEEESQEEDQEDDIDPIQMEDPSILFDLIDARPNYNSSLNSRTMYQVDQSVDLIAQKLSDIYAVFLAHGLIEE